MSVDGTAIQIKANNSRQSNNGNEVVSTDYNVILIQMSLINKNMRSSHVICERTHTTRSCVSYIGAGSQKRRMHTTVIQTVARAHIAVLRGAVWLKCFVQNGCTKITST